MKRSTKFKRPSMAFADKDKIVKISLTNNVLFSVLNIM